MCLLQNDYRLEYIPTVMKDVHLSQRIYLRCYSDSTDPSKGTMSGGMDGRFHLTDPKEKGRN